MESNDGKQGVSVGTIQEKARYRGWTTGGWGVVLSQQKGTGDTT